MRAKSSKQLGASHQFMNDCLGSVIFNLSSIKLGCIRRFLDLFWQLNGRVAILTTLIWAHSLKQ